MSALVEQWFGPAFADLHPSLQHLHQRGGVLRGSVEVIFGTGIAGVLGRRLARRLGIAREKTLNDLEVTIYSDSDGLHWNRRFNGYEEFRSTFRPCGRFPDGHWQESSGALQSWLQVAIVNRGWHWRHVKTSVYGVALPAWLAPRTIAYKEIEGDGYRFRVCIELPFLGMLLSYSGKLHGESL